MTARLSTSFLVAVSGLICATGVSALAAAAAEPNEPKPGVSLTVYPKFGVVTEVRAVDIAADGSAELDDVAATIDPTSVRFESLTDPNAKVIEQNFQNDVVSATALLGKYLGKSVAVGTSQKVYDGTLLTGPMEGYRDYQGSMGQLVIKDASGQLVLLQAAEVKSVHFGEMPKGLRLRPTLLWRVETKKPGKQMARISYQVEDFAWHAEYSLVLDDADAKADLSAWVSVENKTGRAYPNAHLKLMAGDVRRESRQDIGGGQGIFSDTSTSSRMAERPLFEYHLYTLGRPVTMANQEIKQVELFDPVRGIAVAKRYLYQPLSEKAWGYFDEYDAGEVFGPDKIRSKVAVLVEFANSKANQLGIPLPAGKVSVYKRNADDGGLDLVGEDKIDHTPRDENLSLQVGSAFDIMGERTQIESLTDERDEMISETVEIIIRNHKDQDVTVRIKEPIRAWRRSQRNWTITKETQKHVKLDSRTVAWDVPVKARGETKLKYAVRYFPYKGLAAVSTQAAEDHDGGDLQSEIRNPQ